MGAVLLPRLSYYLKEKRQTEFKDLTVRSLQFVCFISIPIWFYFTIFAKESVYCLSGTAYTGAILPMQNCNAYTFFDRDFKFIGNSNISPFKIEKKRCLQVCFFRSSCEFSYKYYLYS